MARPYAMVSGVMKAFIASVFSLLMLLAASAQASDDLYVGELPVQTEKGEIVPVSDVLNQVLVRLTGEVGQDLVKRLVLEDSDIEAMVLTREFRQIEVPQADGRSRSLRMQRIEFDSRALNQRLEQFGLSRWGSERPNLLFWVVADQDGRASYLLEDAYIDYAIRRAAFRYGLNLIRPILDAGDQIEVSPSDIRGGFTDAALPAMRRYGAGGIIMLDLRSNQNFTTGRWAWRLGDLERGFERSGEDAAEVVDIGLSQIATALSRRLAVRAGQTSVQQLVVSGMSSPLHYAEVLNVLNGLTGVDSLRVLEADAQSIMFELVTNASGLESRIGLSGLLQFERRDPITGELHYRLVW
ncbi:MAG: DUF2066 domain-containing protein [Pseudomonadota bacterium]